MTSNSETNKKSMEVEYEDSDSDSINDEDEETVEAEPTKCLFCENEFQAIEDAIKHLDSSHEIRLPRLKSKFKMDQYSYIKLVNYIRAEKPKPQDILSSKLAFWSDEKYLKPVEYEPWLTYDFEDMPTEGVESSPEETVTIEEYKNMEALVATLSARVKDCERILEESTENVAKMRIAYHRLIEKDNGEEPVPATTVGTSIDNYYFDSYSHFGIHHEMLSDTVRTTTYRDALMKNKEFISGKTVMDLGCGTSILSIFASQAGAKKIIAVDNSDIIYNAMDIVKKNNVENISFVKGCIENVELPVEKVDIIISEWMGYFLLFEGMLDSVIYARDNHLNDGGILMPNRCTMSLVGYGDDALYNKHITFWDSVYGLDMSTVKKESLHEPLIEVVDAKYVLTEPNVIADLDLATVTANYSNFSFDFELKCMAGGRLTSFVGYFDTYFGGLPNPVEFSTSPFAEPTHWKQVVFFLAEPRMVRREEIVKGTLVCRRSRKTMRSLDIKIKVFGKEYTYYLD